ncbi:MAG: hypothetical protein ABEH78_08230 [Haloferacaceae archaeon]
MRDLRTLAFSPFGALALGSVGGLCLLVASVGAVAVVAELAGLWRYYFLMERTIAVATPIALVLLGATFFSGLGAVLRVR